MSTQDGMDLAKELDLMFIETSAKTNQGINDLFENLLEVILDETIEKDGQNNDEDGGTENTAAGKGKKPLDISNYFIL